MDGANGDSGCGGGVAGGIEVDYQCSLSGNLYHAGIVGIRDIDIAAVDCQIEAIAETRTPVLRVNWVPYAPKLGAVVCEEPGISYTVPSFLLGSVGDIDIASVRQRLLDPRVRSRPTAPMRWKDLREIKDLLFPGIGGQVSPIGSEATS